MASGQFKEVAQLVGVTDVYDGRSIALGRFRKPRRAGCGGGKSERGRCCFTGTRCRRTTVGSNSSWKAASQQSQRDRRAGAVFWNGQQQLQEVSGGSGFCAQNQRRLHFGLGKTGRHRSGGDSLAVGQNADHRRAES
jgi:hypothetical protein